MTRLFFLAGIAFCILLANCQSARREKTSESELLREIPLKYAEAFKLLALEDGYQIQIVDPKSGNVEQVFNFGIDGNEDFLPLAPSSVVSVSTTYLSYIRALNKLNTLSGVSNPELIYNPEIRKKFRDGGIIDIGHDQSPDYEKLIELAPDLIFHYNFGPSTQATIERLTGLGLEVVTVSEFRETNPLGKAEWIKFFGAVYNEMELANELFDEIEAKYLLLLNSSMEFAPPLVFSGLPWKGEWYQPGGASFQAQLFKDAGGNYIWSDNKHVSGISVDRESVFDKALAADIWIHPSDKMKLSEIAREDKRFVQFRSFQNGLVYNNNKRINKNGGNDYWESGPLHPDLILLDLMAIFHPEAFPDHELFYYQKLE